MIPNIEEYYESFRKFNQNQKMKKKKKICDKKTLLTEITTTKMQCFYSIQYIYPKSKNAQHG